jgi:archaellum component FlaC
MEANERIIEALYALGISKEWLLTGKGNIQSNNAPDNKGIVGIQGDNSTVKVGGDKAGVDDFEKKIATLHENYKALQTRLEKLGKTAKKSRRFYLIIFLVIIASAAAFWFLAVASYKYFGFALDANNVILTLVGILATFVVISNYAQVVEVKNEFKEKLSTAESLGDEIKRLEEKFERTANDAKEIEEKLERFEKELKKKADAYLNVSEKEIVFPSEGGTKTFTVDSNVPWTLKVDEDEKPKQ